VFGFASLAAESDGIFAPPPMVSFVRAKNLGITEIDEGNGGEIVENFGTKSWDIDIKGLLIEMDEHHYPQQKVRQLARFFEINDIVSVTSPIFQDLGIDSIYFSEHRMEPLEGFPDTVRFELKAKSAMPAEFSILNDKTLQLA
jgi:hypothetical protein